MFGLIMRHYRRFTTFCIGMSLMSVAVSSTMFQISSHLVLALMFFGSCALFFVVGLALYLTRPSKRSVLEIMGICAGVTTMAMVYLENKVGIQALTWILIFATITLATRHFIHSKYANKLGENSIWKDRYAGQLPYPARLVWKHVVPGAADHFDHYTGMMESCERDDEDPTTVNVTFKGRSERRAEYALTFLEESKPNVCRFFFQGEEADGTFVDGICAIRITHLDNNTSFLACNEERRGLSIAGQIERWFDDAMGLQHDLLLSKLNDFYADGQGITKPMSPTA